MEPKSMPKSYSNDFGRPKGRPGPIMNVFRSKKGGKRVVQKNDAKFEGVQTCRKSNPRHQREDFGAGGEVYKEGTSPSGTGDFGLDSVIQSKTPCTRRGAADTF